ncbi:MULTISPECIES: ABC transporter permease subunit [Actinosynnema]|uniref:ABC transporter permease n=1 Tax=Actinosynnema pretiosum TaxID=42197 RepID=A0A290Z7K2_9PSEU|nr:ABC transporter permease subunit [Actinosynnema pretiosum]ATE55007.1 ABC transporter permease [Actinosynnema pretiosum]
MNGAAEGFRPAGALRVRVELRRQLRRRRTALVLALSSAVPLVLLVSFALGGERTEPGVVDYSELAASGAANFVVFCLFVAGTYLQPVTVALFFGDAVAGEAARGSLKYLLAVPVGRGALLARKALVAAVLSAASLAVLPLTALTAGVAWYGLGDLTSPTGDTVSFARSLPLLGVAVLYSVAQLSWVAALALLLSVATDVPLGAVGGAVLATMVSQILDQVGALGSVREFLPTHRSWSWMDVVATRPHWDGVAEGLLVSSVYAAVFATAAVWWFGRKDVRG